jgi:hypothetical protein
MAAVMIGCQKVVHYESRLFANIKKDVANDGLWQRLTSGVIVLIKIFSSSPKMLKFRKFSATVCLSVIMICFCNLEIVRIND